MTGTKAMELIARRARPWELTQAPPLASRRFCYPVTKDVAGYVAPGTEVLAIDTNKMTATFVVTAFTQDRMGDVVVPQGCLETIDTYRRNPVFFFGHQLMPLPIGKAEDPEGRFTLAVENDKAVTATCWFYQGKRAPDGEAAKNAADVFALVAERLLRMTSIGFRVIDGVPIVPRGQAAPRPDEHTGIYITKWELLEVSIVGVPANPYCGVVGAQGGDAADRIASYLSRGRITEKTISPHLRKALAPLAAPKKVWSPGMTYTPKGLLGEISKVKARPADPPLWNRSLSKAFEVASESLPPSCLQYDWVSRYCECEIKHLHMSSTSVPSARMGSFLTGLKHTLAEHELEDVRNLSGSSESPPQREVIQLNSKLRDDFLVRGSAFYRGKAGRFVVEYQATYWGLELTVYTRDQDRAFGQEVLDKSWDWARQNNFLKGEAFALSGEFLTRTFETWDDVFLEEANKVPLKRTIDLLNTKQKAFANRGVILTGPPGTGKTLSGRIIRNSANATFIWISSRDFHRSGSFGGLGFGFELARELAPSVLFIEDVDNWLHETTIDLVKTEMDGIARSSGVLTILTTNFPERLPAALIDRPGRFHDVLHFAVPTSSARREMLAKWLEGVEGRVIDEVVAKTDGYSGAHVYELAQFVRVLREHDGMPPAEAVSQALRKIEEQRDLITEIQLQGSNYRPRTHGAPALVKGVISMAKKSGNPGATKTLDVPQASSNTPTAVEPATKGDGPDALGQQSGSVQCVHLPKDLFASKEEAIQWAAEHGLASDKLTEQDGAYCFEQFPKENCIDGSLQEMQGEGGAKVYICNSKAESGESGDAVPTKPGEAGELPGQKGIKLRWAPRMTLLPGGLAVRYGKDGRLTALKRCAPCGKKGAKPIWVKLADAVQATIADKIPKLLKAGYTQEMAAAIAMQGVKAMPEDEAENKDLTTDDAGQGAPLGADQPPAGPPGHGFVKACKAVLDEHRPNQEHPEMVKACMKSDAFLREHSKRAYPDADFKFDDLPESGGDDQVSEKKKSLEDGGEQMPPGHALVKCMKKALDDHLPKQEHPEMVKMGQKIGKAFRDHSAKAYPGADFGFDAEDAETKDDDQPADKETDAESTEGTDDGLEALLDEGKGLDSDEGDSTEETDLVDDDEEDDAEEESPEEEEEKSLDDEEDVDTKEDDEDEAQTKGDDALSEGGGEVDPKTKAIVVKRLNGRCKAMVRKAADHLYKMAKADYANADHHDIYRDAHSYHARGLYKMLKGLSEGDVPGDDDDDAPATTKVAVTVTKEVEAQVLEELKKINSQVAESERRLLEASGEIED